MWGKDRLRPKKLGPEERRRINAEQVDCWAVCDN